MPVLATLILVVFVIAGLRISPKTIKVSWYNPALLGTNCAVARNGICISTTASGMAWQDGLGWSAACPNKYPFNTIVFAGSFHPWVCKDRGGGIVLLSRNRAWIDMLVERPVYPYGTEVPGVFIYFDPIWRWLR